MIKAIVRRRKRENNCRSRNSIRFQYDLNGETNRQGEAAPKERADRIIGQLDEGGDRKLSKEEFIAG